jgi:hypothetical protein
MLYLTLLKDFFRRYQGFVIFILVLFLILICDALFSLIFPSNDAPLIQLIFTEKEGSNFDFAPEVWLGVLGLVIGTLIIVISIASQSTPKLIDLYIKDRISLLYVWFLTLASAHNIVLQFYAAAGAQYRESSILLNTYFFLPLAVLFAIPYILYILRYTKTSNVIEKIFRENVFLIKKISNPSSHRLFLTTSIRERIHAELFESMNQLDDLLQYVEFKEPKGDILNKMGDSVRLYISQKNKYPDSFYEISDKIKEDISFKTMRGQMEDLIESKTFYEQKVFRLWGNAYIDLINEGSFDLASLCVYEQYETGKVAIECNDSSLIYSTIVRFNTFLRFGIKQGLRHGEIRNLYNAIFHYTEFIALLVDARKEECIDQACAFLKIYGTEIYKHSQKEGSFTFLVDVFAWELKKILILLSEKNFEKDFQEKILDLLLEMDNPPDVDRDNLGQKRIINDGVRVLQVGIALYYLSIKNSFFCEKIIDDILEDAYYLGDDIKIAVESSCNKIRVFGPGFWEDTDRGNTNIYYAPNKEFIPEFLELFGQKLDALKASGNEKNNMQNTPE